MTFPIGGKTDGYTVLLNQLVVVEAHGVYHEVPLT
jgi:hypothetical protein